MLATLLASTQSSGLAFIGLIILIVAIVKISKAASRQYLKITDPKKYRQLLEAERAEEELQKAKEDRKRERTKGALNMGATLFRIFWGK
jgi:hypothetical protein